MVNLTHRQIKVVLGLLAARIESRNAVGMIGKAVYRKLGVVGRAG